MTVSSGDWGQNEFENAILSIQKYQDNPKTDFANLLGVSYNNVREIYYFHEFLPLYFARFPLNFEMTLAWILWNFEKFWCENLFFFFSGLQQYQGVKMQTIQMLPRLIRSLSCPRPNVSHYLPSWPNSSITCKWIGKLEFLQKLVVHG